MATSNKLPRRRRVWEFAGIPSILSQWNLGDSKALASVVLSRRAFFAACAGALSIAEGKAESGKRHKPSGRLAFVSGNFGDPKHRKIWIVNPDGSERRPLTDDDYTAGEDHPAWSPDGSTILFSAMRGDVRRVYRRRVGNNKNEDVSVKAAETVDCDQPAWAPDGKKIAYCVWTRDRRSSQIFTANLDGSETRQLTHGRGMHVFPCWAPDGRGIYYEATADGSREIYRIGTEGENRENLTNNHATDHSPACSPDGMKLAFMSRRRLGIAEIWVVDVDGANPVNLTFNRAFRDSEPDWSPDGRWIAFTRQKQGRSPNPMDIWIMKADGNSAVNITNSPLSVDNWAPCWGR